MLSKMEENMRANMEDARKTFKKDFDEMRDKAQRCEEMVKGIDQGG